MSSYLGIPEDINESKYKLFVFLKDKLQNIVNGWLWRQSLKEEK